jgi:putative transposase
MAEFADDRHRAYLARTFGAHAAYTLHYHLVWSVKGRRPALDGAVAEALRDELLRIAERAGITILALHIEPEHLHALLSLRPDMAVATAVGRLKGASAHFLRQAFPHLRTAHERSLWNDGYFARTLGDVSAAQAKAYLDRQRARHTDARVDRAEQGAG